MSLDVNALGRLLKDPTEKTSSNDKKYAQFTFVTDAGVRDDNDKRKPLFLDIIAWAGRPKQY